MLSITKKFKTALGCALKGLMYTSFVAVYIAVLYCVMFFITWGFYEGDVNWWGVGGRFALVIWALLTFITCKQRAT